VEKVGAFKGRLPPELPAATAMSEAFAGLVSSGDSARKPPVATLTLLPGDVW
jgi:hypothetical protein